jgi:hypothetical protein
MMNHKKRRKKTLNTVEITFLTNNGLFNIYSHFSYSLWDISKCVNEIPIVKNMKKKKSRLHDRK